MADAERWRESLVELLPDLRAYARFLLRDPSRADDLVQETAARALAAFGQFQSGTSLKAWMFTIQRNLFLEQARRRKREESALREQQQTQDEAAPPDADVADLARMLWTLPPNLREALVLVGAEGLSHEEAASICGVEVGTMRARVSRARSKLARTFEAANH